MKIKNKLTGEVREVSPDQLSQYGLSAPPSLPNDPSKVEFNQPTTTPTPLPAKPSEAMAKPKTINQYGYSVDQLYQAKQKADAAGDKDYSSFYGKLLKDETDYQTYLKGTMPTPEEQKSEKASSGILGLTDELKRLYNQPLPNGSTPQGAGDNLSSGQAGTPAFISSLSTDAAIALNQAPNAKEYKRLKEGFTATLKELTGDTGVLTDQDYKRLSDALPNFGDSDETARQAWESFDRVLMGKLGQVGKYSYLPVENQTSQPTTTPQNLGATPPDLGATENPVLKAGKGVADFLLHGAENIAQDVGASIGNNDMTTNNVSLQMADRLLEKAKQTTDPEEKARLLKVAQDLSQTTSSNAQQTASSYSKDITRNPLDRGIEAGSEIASTLALPDLVGGVANKVTTSTVKGASAARTAAAEASDAIIKSDKVLQAGENYVTKDPTAKALWDKVWPSLSENMDAKTALDKLQVYNKAYSAAGKVGNSAKAGLYDALSKAIRAEVQTQAPDVFAAHEALKQALGRSKFFGKVFSPYTIGSGLTMAAMYKLLGKVFK